MFLYGIHVDPRVPLRQKTEMGPLCNFRARFQLGLLSISDGDGDAQKWKLKIASPVSINQWLVIWMEMGMQNGNGNR